MVTKDMQAPDGGSSSAQRALTILTCFRHGDDALSLAEIASRTGLVKSTILRQLSSLGQANLVIRVDNKYRLGSEIYRLHSIYSASQGLDAVIVPMLQTLAEQTLETAAFYTEQEGQRFCQFRANSPQALRLDIAPGSYRPLDNASSAQILKLFRNWPDEQPPIPAIPLYTAGATNPHTASVSLPILGQGDRLVGALSITGPSSRLTYDAAKRIEGQIMDAAMRMSRTLGADLSTFGAFDQSKL